MRLRYLLAVDSPASVERASRVLFDFLDRMSCKAKPAAMESLARTDLTFSQIRALFAVGAAEDSQSVHEIAESIGLSLAATGRTVDHLVRLGLVDRREDPADRRVKRISMTAAGKELIAEQLSIRREVITDFVTGLPAEHRLALSQALGPIVDAEVDYFDPNRPAHDQKASS